MDDFYCDDTQIQREALLALERTFDEMICNGKEGREQNGGDKSE